MLRRSLGWLCLILVGIVPLILYYAAQTSPSVIIHDEYGNAIINFEVAHTAVFTSGECVDVAWSVEGIREVYLGSEPTVGQMVAANLVHHRFVKWVSLVSSALPFQLHGYRESDVHAANFPIRVDTYSACPN